MPASYENTEDAWVLARDGLRKVHAAITEDPGSASKPSMSSALTWITFKNILHKGAESDIRPEVLEQLLDWGADPNYENGKWLRTVLRNLDSEHIRPFFTHGASLDHVAAELEAQKGNSKITANIRGALAGEAFTGRSGDDALVETRFIAEAGGLATLQTVFNFSARRVQEIYAPPEGQPALHSTPFADCDAAALTQAAKRLRELGGKPPDDVLALDKPLRAAAPGLHPKRR